MAHAFYPRITEVAFTGHLLWRGYQACNTTAATNHWLGGAVRLLESFVKDPQLAEKGSPKNRSDTGGDRGL